MQETGCEIICGASTTLAAKGLRIMMLMKQGPCFTAREMDGGDKRLVELELACEVDGVTPPDPV